MTPRTCGEAGRCHRRSQHGSTLHVEQDTVARRGSERAMRGAGGSRGGSRVPASSKCMKRTGPSFYASFIHLF